MKKIISPIAFLILLNGFFMTEAQNYIPFPLQNCYWILSKSWGSSDFNQSQTCLYNENYKIFPLNDTLVNGVRYIKFYSQYLNGGGSTLSGPPCSPYSAPTTTLGYAYCVRQDTVNRKLYMVYQNTTVEKLMFDFNQSVNDTIKAESGKFGSTPPGGNTQYRIIDSVYYKSYSDGLCHKVYKLKPFLNSVGLTANTQIIEGYGNETGLINKVKSGSYGGGFGVTNFESYNATLVVNSNTLSPVANTCQGLGLQEYKSEGLFIYPNPVTDILRFNIPEMNGKVVQLYSSTWQEMKTKSSDNNSTIDMSGLLPGCYYLKITSPNQTYFKKILKVNP